MELSGQEASNVAIMLQRYFTAVLEAQDSGEWSKADEAIEAIKKYQAEFGATVMPASNRVDLELAFNKYKIFQNLTPVYLLAGLALLIVVFVKMLRPKIRINLIFKIAYWINILAFIVHTIGMGLRWYIAEHAPWSDGYESLVFIAWCLAFSGTMFARSSAISLALTSILAGVTLFVAHLSWLDPQITNLVPVLQSYWLTIHVSVITASYGFLGLCSLLGLFTLVLFALQGKKENKELTRNIIEATRINEMAMILGLSLLVVGNFLGGVWANESWGRYWGWDSKETWALVSILVYAAVVHMRFIPRVNSQYAFAVASMFAYSAIIMTYFGVNFYLVGMHSYAAGDAVPVPNFVWIALVVMVVISLLAYRKRSYSARL
jgi:cytochrome c-type biogenesis protein CcsB